MKQIKRNWVSSSKLILSNTPPIHEHKGQLRDYQKFLLENTYWARKDEENETKLRYFYQMMKNQATSHKKTTFEDLNEIVENFSESKLLTLIYLLI